MARLTEKQTLGLIAGVTLLIAGGAGGGVWWAKGLVEEQQNEIAAKQKKIQAAQVKIKKIPQTINEVIVLRESVAEHVKILPSNAEIEDFFRAAQRFTEQSGIRVDLFKPVRGRGRGGAFQRVSYTLKFESSLWQFMKFMNFFESYERFVKVRSFDLKAGERRDDDEPVRHNISMTVETYVYTTKVAGKLAKIAGYEEKRKKLLAKIRNSAPLLLEEPYQFRNQQGRRDPFVDPRRRIGEDDGPKISPERQKEMIRTISKVVEELRESWEASKDSSKTMFETLELKRSVRVGLATLRPKVEDAVVRSFTNNYRAEWYKLVRTPYNELRKEVEQTEDPREVFLTVDEFKSVIKKLKQALTSGKHSDAEAYYTTVMERTRVPAADPRFPLRNRVESLVLRAKVAIEFAAKKLEVTGVLVNGQGKSGVIINGEVFQEGEFIEQNLFVKAVREEEVEFVYRGFTLVKTF